MTAQEFKGNAVVTTLATGISGADLAVAVSDATNWPTGAGGKKFVALIEEGSAKEKVLCTSRSGTTLTVDPTGRGYDGTAAQSFTTAAVVTHVLDALAVQEMNDHVNDTNADDHTQYLNTTRHANTALHTFSSGALATPGTPQDVGTSPAAGSGPGPAASNHVHKIGAGAINSAGLFAAGVVGSAALGASAVIAGKIAAGAIVNADINAAAAIAQSKIAGLGTAASLNAPASGDAAAGEVVKGSDTRLTNTRTPTDNTVSTAKIQDNSVSTAKLQANAVTSAKLASGIIGMDMASVIGTLVTDIALTTYEDYPDGADVLTLSYTKKEADSVLFCYLSGSWYPNNNTTKLAYFGIQIDAGTVAEVARYFYNTQGWTGGYPPINNSDHYALSGWAKFTGIAAGARTIKAKCKATSGGSIRHDTNDFTQLLVLEVLQ